jgi:hypothetical protein
VLTSSGISRRLSLFYYGREIVLESESGSIHLSTEGDSLKLYVPSTRSKRDLCLKSQVPKRLMKFLGVIDPGTEALLSSIINLNSLRSVVQLLEDEGVVDIDGIMPNDLNLGDDDSDTESQFSTIAPFSVMTPSSTPSPLRPTLPSTPPPSNSRVAKHPPFGASSPVSPSSIRSTPPLVVDADRQGSLSAIRQTSPQPMVGTPLMPQIEQHASEIDAAHVLSGYSTILERCLHAAHADQIPPRDLHHLYATGSTTEGLRTTFEFLFSGRSLFRDKKVGAAGELFVSSEAEYCDSNTDRIRCLKC